MRNDLYRPVGEAVVLLLETAAQARLEETLMQLIGENSVDDAAVAFGMGKVLSVMQPLWPMVGDAMDDGLVRSRQQKLSGEEYALLQAISDLNVKCARCVIEWYEWMQTEPLHYRLILMSFAELKSSCALVAMAEGRFKFTPSE